MTPFLAQYSIRSKQDFIYRTNRLREVTGASAMIAAAFDMLFQTAEEIGAHVIRTDHAHPEKGFSLAETLKLFEETPFSMTELFEGGGNDTILMDSKETFRKVNRAYTRKLMETCPGMVPLCVGVPIYPETDGKYNYIADYQKLSQAASREKSVMTSGQPHDTLPFAMTDSVTRQPFQPERVPGQPKDMRLSHESLAKLKFYINQKEDEEARQLDDLLEDGDSMLAVIHADGNNMGKKLKTLLSGRQDYDSCVPILRVFSEDIDRVFIREGETAIREEVQKIQEEQPGKSEQAFAVRSMISDGDDFTFICNAKWALRLTRAYLKQVASNESFSACAGICIFHRHYPFARAYDLAEQACDSAKEKVHKEPAPDECWIDFHYLHGGVPDDLIETRENHGTNLCMLRPWRCDGRDADVTAEKMEQLSRAMISGKGTAGKTTRTNLKTVGTAMETSISEAKREMERIYFRAPELREKLQEIFPDPDKLLRAIYDLSEIYDLWFSGREEYGNH